MKRIAVLVTLALAIVACSGTDGQTSLPAGPPGTVGSIATAGSLDLAGVSMQVHEPDGCGCCVGWVGYLQDLGADLDVKVDEQIETFKLANGIPEEAHSCHTALVDGYVVEGHVPAGAILRLLEDRPDIVGLALPGMPGDSPGMGGDPTTWESQPVLAITTAGELLPFEY